MVVCASFVYFIERGRWNDQFGYWERATSYRCAVVVPKDAAPGVTASTGARRDDGAVLLRGVR